MKDSNVLPSQNPSEPIRDRSFGSLAPNVALAAACTLRDAVRAGLAVVVFETFRSDERAVWLYASGRDRPGRIVTNAPNALFSWHGYGLAIDFVFVNSRGGYFWPDTNDPRWRSLEGHAAKYGLRSGRLWKKHPDAPHFQPSNLRISPSAKARELFASGGLLAVWKEVRHDRLYLLDSGMAP